MLRRVAIFCAIGNNERKQKIATLRSRGLAIEVQKMFLKKFCISLCYVNVG